MAACRIDSSIGAAGAAEADALGFAEVEATGDEAGGGFGAEDTGGTAFVPKFRSMDAKLSYDKATNIRLNGELLDTIFRQLANELRSQYLVQYYSESEYPNGKYVKLDVTVPTRPGVKIRARQGYYAKSN